MFYTITFYNLYSFVLNYNNICQVDLLNLDEIKGDEHDKKPFKLETPLKDTLHTKIQLDLQLGESKCSTCLI